jgi:hypothetical protein
MVLFIAIVIGIVVGLATLLVAISAMREGRRVSKTLEENSHRWNTICSEPIGMRWMLRRKCGS